MLFLRKKFSCQWLTMTILVQELEEYHCHRLDTYRGEQAVVNTLEPYEKVYPPFFWQPGEK